VLSFKYLLKKKLMEGWSSTEGKGSRVSPTITLKTDLRLRARKRETYVAGMSREKKRILQKKNAKLG